MEKRQVCEGEKEQETKEVTKIRGTLLHLTLTVLYKPIVSAAIRY